MREDSSSATKWQPRVPTRKERGTTRQRGATRWRGSEAARRDDPLLTHIDTASRHRFTYDRNMTDRTELLITAADLDAQLRSEAQLPPDAPRTRVLDVRWTLAKPNGHDDFVAGHIPGAVYVDLDTELASHGPATAGRHPLPGLEQFTAAARRWGLNDGDNVVAYDGGGNLGAGRLWWLLRYFGVSDVRLLDGALPAWVAAGLPLEQGEAMPAGTKPAEGSVALSPGHMPTVEFAEVADFARSSVLLDARAPERYAGEVEPMDPQAGHIPGARNLPTTGNLDGDGFFLPTETLRARFDGVGATGEVPVGIYCGSGVTASHALFALAVAGIDGALYPGSWSQWSNHPELPVATGPTP